MSLRVRQNKKRNEIDRAARDLTVNHQPQKALRLIDQYLSASEAKDVGLLVLKGNIFESQGKFAAAKEVYEATIKIDPSNTQALIDLGEYHAESRRHYNKALGYFNRAISILQRGRFIGNLEDEYVDACTGKASLLVKLRKPREALEVIVDGLKRFPTSRLLSDSLQEAQANFHKRKSLPRPFRQPNPKHSVK